MSSNAASPGNDAKPTVGEVFADIRDSMFIQEHFSRADLVSIRDSLDDIERKLDLLLLPPEARAVIHDGTICNLPKGVHLDGHPPKS